MDIASSTATRHAAMPAAHVFETVNNFIGQHVECTDIGEDVSYNVVLTERTGECIVVVRCACGATTQLPMRSDEGRALISVAQRPGRRPRGILVLTRV